MRMVVLFSSACPLISLRGGGSWQNVLRCRWLSPDGWRKPEQANRLAQPDRAERAQPHQPPLLGRIATPSACVDTSLSRQHRILLKGGLERGTLSDRYPGREGAV